MEENSSSTPKLPVPFKTGWTAPKDSPKGQPQRTAYEMVRLDGFQLSKVFTRHTPHDTLHVARAYREAPITLKLL